MSKMDENGNLSNIIEIQFNDYCKLTVLEVNLRKIEPASSIFLQIRQTKQLICI